MIPKWWVCVYVCVQSQDVSLGNIWLRRPDGELHAWEISVVSLPSLNSLLEVTPAADNALHAHTTYVHAY